MAEHNSQTGDRGTRIAAGVIIAIIAAFPLGAIPMMILDGLAYHGQSLQARYTPLLLLMSFIIAAAGFCAVCYIASKITRALLCLLPAVLFAAWLLGNQITPTLLDSFNRTTTTPAHTRQTIVLNTSSKRECSKYSCYMAYQTQLQAWDAGQNDIETGMKSPVSSGQSVCLDEHLGRLGDKWFDHLRACP